MKVTQSPITLEEVLKDTILEVPLHQREYSWELDQVADLFYDIQDAEPEQGHFIGSLLLYEKEEPTGKIMEIIDGQQRLTTIFLILYSIRNVIQNTPYGKAIEGINNLLYKRSRSLLIADNSEEPRLTTSKRDKKLFKAIMQGREIDQHIDKRVKSHKLLFNAYNNFLKEKIEKLKTDKGVEGVINYADKVLNVNFIV